MMTMKESVAALAEAERYSARNYHPLPVVLAEGDGSLSPLQLAFLETGGAQCGICTPGMLIAGQAYLDGGGSGEEDAIREAIAGNLCRCGCYEQIIDAVLTREPASAVSATSAR